MVKSMTAFVAALTATTIFSAGAAWAANPPEPPARPATTQQGSADKDFGKLSADGAAALQDLLLTRLAIFEGRTDDAKKFVNMADAAFGKAKSDDTAFTKAESDLKSPAGKDMQGGWIGTESALDDASHKEELKKPIAWLPVDGSITIGEDFSTSPAKTAAVADANKSLKSGNRKGAIEKLKLVDMKIAIVVAVLPLDQTIDQVHQAAALINEGKYYEASQVLRKTQADERYDVVDNLGTPSE